MHSHKKQGKKDSEKKMKLIIYSLLLSGTFCFAQNEDQKSKIGYFTEKAQKYLDKEKALSGYYSIEQDGIKIYESPAAKNAHKPEFSVDWDDLENFRTALRSFPNGKIFEKFNNGKYMAVEGLNNFQEEEKNSNLKGKKIAIDPGHLANDVEMGDLEKKQIKFKKDSLHGINDSIEITEGILTYATAQLLKQKLEAEGAEVLITRKNNGSAFGKTFYQWKKDDLKSAIDSLYKIGEIKAAQKQYFLSDKAKDRDIFRVIFKDLELAKRAEIVNNYNPDFTIIIHFNVDESNLGWEKPGVKNFNMTFVGGAFMKNDLANKEKRFEFLRLLASEDLEKSITLSSSMIKSFGKILNVKTAGIHDASYLIEGCLTTGKDGVYCRNLQLTRYIHSPLVYGETLCQDNINEALLLNKEKDKTKNERVKQVAEAYYLGIIDYISTSH
jgi:N-acetylmuramoyl-L-alanine amidase